MPYNDKVEIDIYGDIAGTSLDEIGKRLIENMAIFDILGAISNGYHDKHGSFPEAPKGVSDAWGAVNDLIAHFDTAVVSLREEPLETNPLTLIRTLWVLNLIDYKEGAALKQRFNDRVKDAVGVELNEDALQGIFDLFNTFDIGQELADIRGVAKKDLRPVPQR